MIIRKYASILCMTIFFMGSAIGEDLGKNALLTPQTPPGALAFVKMLLKNGSLIEKSCDTVVSGETLLDNFASLVSPQDFETRVVITYKCMDDKRETRDTQQLVSVWRCVFRGQGIWKNAGKELKKEGFDIENMDIVDGEMEVYSASIYAYLDKKDLSIVDLLCL